MNKIKKEHWRDIESSNTCTEDVMLHCIISKEDFQKISFGFLPKSMDDKWFVYEESDQIFFYRSWTGKCIAILYCVESFNNYVIEKVSFNGDFTTNISKSELTQDIFETLYNLFQVRIE